MSPPSPQSPLFERAGQRFDLNRLHSDLERTGEITLTEWKYLKGILCGLDQKEIAKQCNVAEGTVKTALTRGVRQQILGLLPDRSEVDWKRLPVWLIEAGYGIGKNRLIDWRQVYREMLDRQKKLSTNEVIASEAMQFDLLDDKIFVSLALVERKEPDRLSQDIHPSRPIEHYEEKRPIEYEAFREQVLRQGKSDRIAIVGEPGAGKTTLLQHIAFWILEQRLGLPIWISLGDLIKGGDLQRLKDYLTQVWLEDAIPNVTEEVKSGFLSQLNHQKVWLLLDGADEIVASSSIALREIHSQLGSWLRQASIVLTCRINVWDVDINALRDFQTYRTKEFRYPTQVEQFIESGFRKSNQSSGERLKIELVKTEHGRLQQLVRNPLRLMMLCTTWYEQESLPETKAELYGRFIEEFYKWNKAKWKKKDLNYALFPNTKAKQERLNKALGRLACRALDEEAAPFRLPNNLVFDELGDSEDDGSDFWLALNLGWLQIARNSDKPSEKVYTFFHPTFQEYFAALAIDDWNYFLPREHEDKLVEGKDNEYRIFQPQWREVFLLWLGRLESRLETQKIELLNKLVSFKDSCGEFYNFRAYFLAVTGFAETNDFPNASEIIENLLSCALGDNRFFDVFAEHARKALVNTNQYLLSLALIKLLRSEQETRVLADAIEFIEETRLNTPEIIEELTQLLESTTNGRLRCLAACALEKICPSFPNILGIIIHYIDEENCQYDAARCLGEIGRNSSEIRDALRNCLKTGFGTVDPFNDTSYLVVASSLLKINPGDEIAISFLNYLLALPGGYIFKIMIAKLLKQNGYVDMTINEILKNSDPFINRLIEMLKNLDIGDFRISELDSNLINTVIIKLTEKLKSCQEKETFGSISYCLEIIFSGNRFKVMNEALFSIPVGFQDRSLEEIQKNSTVLWYCAENMNYPDFFRAWHNSLQVNSWLQPAREMKT